MEQAAYCTVSIAPVRAEESDRSEIVTQLLFGEVVEVIQRKEKWCEIRTFHDNYIGWVDPKQIKNLTKKEVNRWLDGMTYQRELLRIISTPWGKQNIFKGSFISTNDEESFNIGNDQFAVIYKTPVSSIYNHIDIAKEYLNAPYLWGGKTPFGIDCSGLIQMTFRFLDINLPRDASQQIDHGAEIDFEDRLPGDVCFFQNDEGKIIHVGLLTETNEIIHASGQVRIDRFDHVGILHQSGEYHTHQLAAIRRML